MVSHAEGAWIFSILPLRMGFMNANFETKQLRAGMVGMGMIFDETYRPFFERVHGEGLYDRSFGDIDVPLAAVASQTGERAEAYLKAAGDRINKFASFAGENCIEQMLEVGIDFACVATPDDRHFEASKRILEAGKHLLVEKPSVLKLQQLDQLAALARKQNVLAKIVYHKLLDPDHKKLRTFVADNVLRHVNSGYCTLLEPKQISGQQFAEWITGRNPGTYVAVHYIKLDHLDGAHVGGNSGAVLSVAEEGSDHVACRGLDGTQSGHSPKESCSPTTSFRSSQTLNRTCMMSPSATT